VEPSPFSIQRITEQLQTLDPVVSKRITVYDKAAGATTGEQLFFSGTGSTLDHVGRGIDNWQMTRMTDASLASVSEAAAASNGTLVESIQLDDIIKKQGQVFLAKIDTQGFEPAVFAGLEDSLRHQKLTFILFEFWPRGSDFLNNKDGQCIAAEVLKKLSHYNYRLFSLETLGVDSFIGQNYKPFRNTRPLLGFQAHCQWYYDLEQLGGTENYPMGYWSDILAVAPHAEQVLGEPVSNIGKVILKVLTTTMAADHKK
jgi:FkbM family methyltransferase